MDKLPIELKMKVFNELIEPSEIKISIVFGFDSGNYYEDYIITKIVSPFSGKETVVCKKITKDGEKDEYKNENVKILQIKDIYKFIKMKFLSLYEGPWSNGPFEILIHSSDGEVDICGDDADLHGDDWIKRKLEILQLYIESIW
jgi:hypothetical protein